MKNDTRLSLRIIYYIGCLCLISFNFIACTQSADQPKILILYRLDTIQKDAGLELESVMELASSQHIMIEVTDKASDFSNQLSQFDAVIFYGDVGASFSREQQSEFEKYLKSGGGFIGIHARPENPDSWLWYRDMYVSVSGKSTSQQVHHVSSRSIPAESTAMVHHQEYGGGKVSLWGDSIKQAIDGQPGFADQFLSSLAYVLFEEGDVTYATAAKRNAEDRFHRRVLQKDIQEGVKLAIAKDGTVYYIERAGKIYKLAPDASSAKASSLVGQVQVSTNVSNGLLGIALDPEFEANNTVYLFYTPKEAESLHQRVSQFQLKEDGLDVSSEKVLLTIPFDEEDGHTGGALLFDDKGNLFISTGDNTNPHEASGFGPMDERPGRSFFDAQRTAGNTASLLGKILRITPKPDGTYTIPEGNLFTGENPKERAEIYVMGCRNPYTMSFDSRTGYLYWGEVGPDAGRDSTRGPRGYDEINQTRSAGFYGWPYFTGENLAYAAYDFATQKIGDVYSSAVPLNNSVNNTGSRVLPPAQPAFISYPYSKSDKFPELGEGTRCAIAGPVYHYDPELKSNIKFPQAYDNVLFIADWSRNWIMAVHLDGEGNYTRFEPLMPLTEFDRPLDLKFGPDGALYMLEYGEPWGVFKTYGNLVRIEYNADNRPPIAVASASDTVGVEPLTVKFSHKGSVDRDGDALQVQWKIGNQVLENTGATPEFTFQKPGQYIAMLTVTDSHGKSSQDWINIKVGNARPEVYVETTANQTFYWDNMRIDYQVKVKDKEDKVINPDNLLVSLDYLPEGKDLAGLFINSRDRQKYKIGKGGTLMENSDCKSCHTLSKPAFGPALLDIARRYNDEEPTVKSLAKKVIQGGGGTWGSFAMSAHPQLSQDDATEIVRYILSLDKNESLPAANLPMRGAFITNKHLGKGNEGLYVFTASYVDNGSKGIGPLSDTWQMRLRNARVNATTFDRFKGVTKTVSAQGDYQLEKISHGDYIAFKGIDLRHVSYLTYKLVPGASDGLIEVRVGSPEGQLISRLNYAGATTNQEWQTMRAPVKDPGGVNALFFVFGGKGEGMRLQWISFDLAQKAALLAHME